MKYDRLWERLIEFLNHWTTATEVEPGRIEVTLAPPDASTTTFEILMTHSQWDDMVTIPFGDFDAAAREVRATIMRMEEHERFLVYGQYELVPSTTPQLPVDPRTARLNELARQHPEGIGRWVVMDRDGNEVDELGLPPG
jgi:hypothetical protein